MVIDVHERGTSRKLELRAIHRAEVHRDDEIDVLGRSLLREAVAAVQETLLLGHGIGAMPRHALAERLQAEPERERRADGVRVRVAVRDECDPVGAVKRRRDLFHRPSRSRASRSSAEIRTACSAERSWTSFIDLLEELFSAHG